MSTNTNCLKAFLSGKIIPIEEVSDPVFSQKMLGNGLAIEPTSNIILAPCDGIISMIMSDTRHAIGITVSNGMELLIHEGIDTIFLKGEGFQLLVKEGEPVNSGDKLIQFDPNQIKEKGYPATCILTVINSDNYPSMILHTGMNAIAGETVIIEV